MLWLVQYPCYISFVLSRSGDWYPNLDGVQERGRTTAMSMESSVDDAVLLRRHGLQVTAQGLAVLRAMSDRPHTTADDIDKVGRAESGAISRQAAYAGLGAPTAKRPRRRVQAAGLPARTHN